LSRSRDPRVSRGSSAPRCFFLFAVLVVVFNLIADVLYAVLDPRIRYA
jgi:ABC-type dipeptide/oligopeptide/nickel transport system permease component